MPKKNWYSIPFRILEYICSISGNYLYPDSFIKNKKFGDFIAFSEREEKTLVGASFPVF